MVAAIIDSHPVFLNGLTQFLFDAYPSVQVVRSSSIQSFETDKGDLQPDFIILGVNGFFKPKELKTFETMVRRMPFTGIIVFYDQLNMALPFFKSGAKGFIAKKDGLAELAACLEMVIAGKRYLNNEAFDWIVHPNA